MRFAIVLFALLMGSACADQAPTPANTAPEATVAGSEVAMERLRQSFPKVPFGQITPSVVPGMFQVQVQGEWLTISADGRFVFVGDVLELREDGPANVIEEGLRAVRAPALAALDPAELITFPAQQQRAEIYVFTDVTCGYCRQLHRQMADYNQRGITVHYLAYPRAGLDSEGSEVLDTVWCSRDRQLAMTEAKTDRPFSQSPRRCDSPVARHYQLGESFGVRGTPAVFTTQGEQLGGYRSPSAMASDLGLE